MVNLFPRSKEQAAIRVLRATEGIISEVRRKGFRENRPQQRPLQVQLLVRLRLSSTSARVSAVPCLEFSKHTECYLPLHNHVIVFISCSRCSRPVSSLASAELLVLIGLLQLHLYFWTSSQLSVSFSFFFFFGCFK